MIDFLLQGGKTMIPLFICSIMSLTVIIERCISLRKQRVLPQTLCDAIRKEDKCDVIQENAAHYESALSRIVNGLSVVKHKSETEKNTIFWALYKKEVIALERGLTALEVIAAITPLLGLLGTVVGMVDVFNVVAEIGVGQASALSSGIAKALITTIAGLSIAIPTLVCHSFFNRSTEKNALVLEELCQMYYQKCIR